MAYIMKENKEMKQKYTIGVDEVGRGPIAGPVFVCAVLIPDTLGKEDFKGIRDSKKLSPKKRDMFFEQFKVLHDKGYIQYSVASVGSKTIDEKGISFAIKAALTKSISGLNAKPEECRVLLDGGLTAPEDFLNQETIIHGDDVEYSIAAASVIAKVSRDREMEKLSEIYPEYLFHQHKGYGTKLHYEKLKEHGLCKIHRRSFIHL
ncbi:MAG: ribonuclease HII [Parcubacteria group bacterium]|nr:ribonuclease HII [Parcubacteria group bacterium]